MTEIERIIKKGVVTKEYLEPEVRNDFLIDAKRKKLFAISIDLLLEIDKVCKKYKLTYWMSGGSLLGCVRHKGFIPWDDDIDLFMPREDYDKFIQLSHEFAYPYFLQTPYTDPQYYYSCARLRNSNTTYIVNTFKYQKFNHGIYISIFPLDNWCYEGGEERYYKIKSLLREETSYMRMSIPTNKRTKLDEERICSYSGRNPLDIYEEIHKIATSVKNECGLVALSVCTVYPMERNVYKKELFESSLIADFEGYKVPIPVGYDRILTINYQNYMDFPPLEQRGEWHKGITIDSDKPYAEYLQEDFGG